jgi:hypothetical protein
MGPEIKNATGNRKEEADGKSGKRFERYVLLHRDPAYVY